MRDVERGHSGWGGLRALPAALLLISSSAVGGLWLRGEFKPAPVVGPPTLDRSDEQRVSLDPKRSSASAVGELPVSSVLNIRQKMHYGDYLWNDEGVAPGVSWVRVDLNAQIISVFRGGHEIGTAVILHGANEKPTPVGSFPVLAKLKDHRSSLYDAAMPYTLRLTNDGVAIHGSNVQSGFATNGCIGVPERFASKLFDEMSLGSKVVIVNP